MSLQLASSPVLSARSKVSIALLIGLSNGFICYLVLVLANSPAGDLGWALRAAGDLVAGRDVYARPYGEDLVPYPLPAGMLLVPLSWLNPALAGGIFFGLSSGLLTWCLLRSNGAWWLLVFSSWPFFYNLVFVQWTPLIMCMAFLSPLLPLLLVKPQIALPMVILHPFSRFGLGLLVLIGLGSLLLDPNWPLVWLQQISGYRGSVPPLLSLPLGPLLLLALLRFRERRTWFFLAMALMPQRVAYDQLALFLLARSRKELIFQIACSWLTLTAILFFDGWTKLPGGWQSWIIMTLYVPALVVVLRRPTAHEPQNPVIQSTVMSLSLPKLWRRQNNTPPGA